MDRQVEWPGWKIERLIGRGSFGAVYEISREVGSTTEKAALKVITIPQNKEAEIQALRYDGYDNESITQYFKDSCVQFENEYAMMADMKGHSNIVYCEDLRRIQHEDGLGWDIYIKMELLTPLKSYLQDKPAPEQAVRLGIDLCKALEECQRLHIVHRDIKPGNIFVGRDGTYKLGDFGIARTMEATMGGTKVGTYEYMAPEVYNNQPYGTAADIYSVGLVLYWMLNDHAGPFIQPRAPLSQRENARTRRLSGEPLPAPAHGDPVLKAIVLKACAYAPEDRYSHPAQMRRVLEALLDDIHPEYTTPPLQNASPHLPQSEEEKSYFKEDRPASLEERKARMTETYGESTVGAGYAYRPAPAPEPVEEESTVGAGYAYRPAPAPEPVEEESTVGVGYAPRPAPAPEPAEEESTVGVGYAPRPAPQPEPRPVSLQMEAENTVRGEKAAPEPEPAPEGKQKYKKLAIVAAVLVVVILAVAVPWEELLFGSTDRFETVYFGHFEQDNNFSNGEEPIEWLVLEVKDGRALLLSKYALICDSYEPTTWENLNIRKWLNESFLYNAFKGSERVAIATTTVSTADNPTYGTYGGAVAKDKVFLLSIYGASQYFHSHTERRCMPTAYARGMGVTSSNGYCRWSLRSPGQSADLRASVTIYGAINQRGETSNRGKDVGVRPAIWVDVNALW